VHSVGWDKYIHSVRQAHIRLTNREEEIIWDLGSGGYYSPKAWYVQLSVDLFNREMKW
jgi:hypothetical protein